jgi:hypothetical protein
MKLLDKLISSYHQFLIALALLNVFRRDKTKSKKKDKSKFPL